MSPVDRLGRIGAKRLHDRSVARIIKRAAARAGLAVNDFSGHSLRAGFVTIAATRGVPLHEIAERTRHSSLDVLR